MRASGYIGSIVAALVGLLIATSPWGVAPAHTPPGSPTGLLPPWPIFRVAIALNEFFEAAAVATRPPPVQVKTLATSYWQSEIAYSLTKSGIIDAVGAERSTCAAVATKLGLVEDFTCRMMDAGASLLLLSASDGVYSLAGAGDMLRTDHPGSLRSFMLMINEESKASWRAAGTKSLKSGISGFKQHYGAEFFDWHSRMNHGRQMSQFDAAMKSFSAEISGSLLIDWKPPKRDALLCDVGGGVGHMLIAMAEHWPETSGIIFDLPPVVKRAAKAVESAGLAGRVRTKGGSFLKKLPRELNQCDGAVHALDRTRVQPVWPHLVCCYSRCYSPRCRRIDSRSHSLLHEVHPTRLGRRALCGHPQEHRRRRQARRQSRDHRLHPRRRRREHGDEQAHDGHQYDGE